MSFMQDPQRFEPARGEAGSAPTPPGLVSLVGAGPGNPELLTLQAARVLQQAQVVLYDHLVSPEVMALVPETANRIYVGKESAHHSLPQEAIIALMIELARSGAPLVRLKGGDSFIFGRGGEEALALAEAGVPFEVVPGITAAQGAGAFAGIPLTHRDHAGTLVLATGHLRGDHEAALDWPLLARARQTVVFYMGVATLPTICTQLVAHGMPADTPAAIVERATLPDQRCITGTLATLAQQAVDEAVRAPALVIVGDVVALQPQLARGLQRVTQPSLV